MSDEIYKPCPAHVTNRKGQIEYCEVGEDGHWGTCVGGRSRWDYWKMLTKWAFLNLKKGDKVKLALDSQDRLWWTVRVRDNRWMILTRHAPFQKKGWKYYTIIDTTEGIRGPCNLVGQGWDAKMSDKACKSLLEALNKPLSDPLNVEISGCNRVNAQITEVKK